MPTRLVHIYTLDGMRRELQRITPGHYHLYHRGWESYPPVDEEENIQQRYATTRQGPPPSTNGHHTWEVHIIGGGPMALMAGIDLATLARQWALPLRIFLYEQTAYGGGVGVAPATIASHAWLHLLGSFYAMTQPEVTLQLQQSTRRLQRLAPAAFSYPPAFTVDMRGDLTDFFEPLEVWYKPVPDRVARTFLACWGMRLPANATLLRISDACIDVRVLGYCLMSKARRLGVHMVPRGVAGLELQGETIHALQLSDGERVVVAPGGQVVLACGAQIRPLLAAAGVHIDGLQVFGSQLLGAPLGIPALFTAIGSVSIVPHDESGRGLINVVGNANRRPLCDVEVRSPHPDPAITRETRQETEELYGVRLPDGNALLSWVGVKTEITTSGERSQVAHARQIPEFLKNGWLTVPGKLSSTAACSASLSRKLLRHLIQDPVAYHLYERLLTGQPIG